MTEQVSETKKRPGFLTVLCILSFIGIGFSIISSILAYVAIKAAAGLVNSVSDAAAGSMGNDAASAAAMEGLSQANSLASNGGLYYILTIVAAVICLVGVIMMWKQKKMGFYIYAVAEIAPPILTFVLLGGFGVLGTFAMVSGLIFPIAFIVMYGLNLKHMS